MRMMYIQSKVMNRSRSNVDKEKKKHKWVDWSIVYRSKNYHAQNLGTASCSQKAYSCIGLIQRYKPASTPTVVPVELEI